MKIAILARGNGEKALHLYGFFKEGDRITVDCVLTDNLQSPVAVKFNEEGIEVLELGAPVIIERLRSHEVKLLVVDGFSDVPESLKEYFGEGIVFPTSAPAAPLEVIKVADRLNAPINPEPIRPSRKEEEEIKSSNDEWAEVFDSTESETEKPQTPPQTPPQVPPYQPQAWFNQGRPSSQTPPQWNGQYPQNQSADSGQAAEPMPDTYLVWSVVITILFSMIPGIIAIIYSTKVSSRYYQGNIEGAKRASRTAQIWCIVSILLGILWMTFYLPLVLLTA